MAIARHALKPADGMGTRCNLAIDMRGGTRLAGNVLSMEGLGRIPDHSNAVAKSETALVLQGRGKVGKRREVFQDTKAVLGVEGCVPLQVAERCERDKREAEVMCGNARMREQFGSDAPATQSRVDVHLADVQAGRTGSLTKDEAHRPR